MLSSSTIFLIILFLLGYIAKNQAIMVAHTIWIETI